MVDIEFLVTLLRNGQVKQTLTIGGARVFEGIVATTTLGTELNTTATIKRNCPCINKRFRQHMGDGIQRPSGLNPILNERGRHA